MRRIWMYVAAAAFAATLLVHVTTMFGVLYDGRVLFWVSLGGIIVICSPCFILAGDSGGPKSKTPQARIRSRIIMGVWFALGFYWFAICYAGLTPAQRAAFHADGEVSFWQGESSITVGQARTLSAFPLLLYAIASLALWNRMQRDRESLLP